MSTSTKAACLAVALGSLVALGGRAADGQSTGSSDPDSPMLQYYLGDPEGNSLSDAQLAKKGGASGVATVGHHDLGGGASNGDVWVERHLDGRYYAYVGQWRGKECDPAYRRGVKVVDVTEPSRPVLVSVVQNPDGTSAEDVQVLTYGTRDILMVGIQSCDRFSDVRRGLALYDVTDPASPVEVGFLDTGRGAAGVHEFFAMRRPDGPVIGVLTVPYSDNRDLPFPPTPGPSRKRGDVRIVDLTDPAHPLALADWGLRDGFPGATDEEIFALQFETGFGCFPRRFGHGADISEDGDTAYVAYWDWGHKILDISTPTRPRLVGTTTYPANVDGDGHSSNVMHVGGRTFLLGADEDLPPNGNCIAPWQGLEGGWGYLRIFDITNPANPVEIGQFRTANSAEVQRRRKGDYSIHNPLVVGDKAYLSWYSDGLRILKFDAGSPAAPTEVAWYVPKAAKDPEQVIPFAAEVWGVVVDDRGLIYLSDMNSGLWIVKEQ